ncbi:MAG TPA: S8 family serine peptidase, partial [Chitinophagaceae bacterium]
MRGIFIPLMAGVILSAASSNQLSAQFSRYAVSLRDKHATSFTFSNPLAYLSQRAIDRRTRYGLAIDSTDLPVPATYVAQISAIPNVTLLNVSKWLNLVTIQTSDPAALAAIRSLPFVTGTAPVAARMNRAGSKTEQVARATSTARSMQAQANYFNYGTSSFNEIHLHKGEFLHNIGLRGQGMEIAMLDNGFNNYTSSSFDAFDSVNANHQVLGTWDFVAREADVTNDGNHGMSCFSTIAGNIPGQFIGKAPYANFWLFQTEDNSSEYPVEEINWACGAERADSSGADVISSSLGYTTFDSTSLSHTYADMNGNTTWAATAADLAAKKGILVLISNGNDGNSAWHFLSTPADGDSVIAVGAVDVNGTLGSFSSYGPSADGRVKPDVASVGVSAFLETANGTPGFGSGTSFACPNMAGLSTCLWQGFPEFNNMQIRAALWAAGSNATTPDARTGYGIPDMRKAFLYLVTQFSTANGSVSGCNASVSWTSKDVSTMSYELERKSASDASFSKIADIPAVTGRSILNTASYQYTDTLTNANAGILQYRIRQVVDTGAGFAYIDTVSLNL